MCYFVLKYKTYDIIQTSVVFFFRFDFLTFAKRSQIMDPEYSLQDVIRCKLCETPVPPLYCRICHIKLCKACAGEHLLDESKFHIVVPIKHRKSIPKKSYPECQIHTTKLCEFHCEQCDNLICVKCISSKKHKTHDVVNILSHLESKTKVIQADIEELEKFIYPTYQKIASSFPEKKADLKRKTDKLTLDINRLGMEWHREVDKIIRKMKSDIKNTELDNLDVLKKQEAEINQILSEITYSISELRKFLDSNDVNLLSKYQSRNAEFRRFPPKRIVSSPVLSTQTIDLEQILLNSFFFLQHRP